MCSCIILAGLVSLIVFSPIAVGSVYIVTYSAMEIMVFGLLLLHIWTSGFEGSGVSKSEGRASRPRGVSDDPAPGFRNPDRFAEGYIRSTLILMLPMFAFLAIVVFQLIPMPLPLIRLISPGTAVVYGNLNFPNNVQHFYPLTQSVYSTTSAFLKWSAYLGIFGLVATYHPTQIRLMGRRWITIVVAAIFTVAFLEAVYGLYIASNRLDLLLWFARRVNVGVAAGTWVNPDHFAGYMNAAILCSFGILAAYMGAGKRGRRDARFPSGSLAKLFFLWILVLGLLVMILAVIFSQARAGHMSLIVGLAFMTIAYSMKRLNLLIPVLIVVTGLGFLWGSWKGLDPILAKWSKAETALYSDRLIVWNGAADLFLKTPAFGTGLGTFELAYPPHKAPKLGSTVIEHVHNDYLEMLSETGIMGFIPWVAFFVFFLYKAIKAWFKRRDGFARGIGAGGIAAAIAVLVHGFADFDLQIPANAIVLFIIMGLTWRTLHTSFE